MRIVGRTVDLRRVEMRNPHIDCRRNQLAHLLFIRRRAIGMAHAHTAKPHGRDGEIA